MKWVLVLVAVCGCDRIFGLGDVTPDAAIDAPTPGAWGSVSVGAHHACALTITGELYCWGEADLGATAAMASSTTPTKVGTTTWTKISAGAFYTCGLSDDKIYCWGDNSEGQVDGGGTSGGAAIVQVGLPPGTPPATQLSTGQFHTCAVAGTELYCWGRNDLTLGTDSKPSQISGTWSSVAVGTDHTCALDSTGDVWCWGANVENDISSDPAMYIDQPTRVGIAPAKAIFSGNEASCAILVSGELWCWGSQMPTQAATTIPAPIADGSDWVDVTIGTVMMCGTRSDGKAYCWGNVSFGGLGDGVWTETEPASTAHAIAADHIATSHTYDNDENTCAIATGHLSCWGDNRGGILGFGAALQSTPIEVASPPNATWQAISSGFNHTCALDSMGNTYCWGADDDGQITGNACTSAPCSVITPTIVASSSTSVVAGQKATCWLATDGTVRCRGANDQNQLGTTDHAAHSSTVALGGSASQLVGGAYATCATASGNQRCWGSIDGNSGTIPTPLISGTFDTVGFGRVADCGLAQTRRTCSGYDYWGDVGDNTTSVNQTMRTGDPTEGSYRQLSFTHTQVCAIVDHINNGNDVGDVVCWGTNYDGEAQPDQVGTELILQPTTVKSNASPLSGCTAVSTGHSMSCAICNGTPTCWGANRNGLLGRGGALYGEGIPAVVRVVSDTWTQIASGEAHTCVLATDGALACWGLGVHGELGDGGHGSSIPVPIADPN